MPCVKRSPAGVISCFISLLGGMLLILATTHPAAGAELPGLLPLSEAIQTRLQEGQDELFCQIELPRFYALRQYLPAWITPRGVRQDIPELLDMINASAFDGLRPGDYHLAVIQEVVGSSGTLENTALTVDAAARLDLLLTDAFLLLGSHLTAGRVNPESIDPEWFANRRQGDMPKLLEGALSSGTVRDSLLKQLPHYPGYHRLKATYRRYLAMVDRPPWPQVPPGDTLKRGDRDARIPLLRERLVAWSGRPLPIENDPEVFDDGLEAALLAFQQRYGLEADGQLGRRTLEALNVPLADRLQQLSANLERWRWLPEDLGSRHILVNIADFHLDVVDEGDTVMRMGVIVGKPYRHTPVFSGDMRYLVFNPTWHVPRSIAVRDKLPLIRKDPTFFQKQDMRLYASDGAVLREIDPALVAWQNVTAANFNFKLSQKPGPNNALGQVKFMFPNRFNVYLHDTPSRELFAKSTRNFSSGCVRLARPLELAELVLRDQSGWDRDRIDAVLASGRETTVTLDHPLPVHLLYWTVFVNAEEEVCFREDIYGRDRRLVEALQRSPS